MKFDRAQKDEYLAIITAYIPDDTQRAKDTQNECSIMKCMYCQGEMVRGTAPLHIDRKDLHVSLDNVPARVCTQCGESDFGETEVNAVQDIIRAVDEQSGKLVRTA